MEDGFVEVSKNLIRYRSLYRMIQKIILLNHQNNYPERLKVDKLQKLQKVDILATSLSILHNYFHGLNKTILRSVSS